MGYRIQGDTIADVVDTEFRNILSAISLLKYDLDVLYTHKLGSFGKCITCFTSSPFARGIRCAASGGSNPDKMH